MARNDDGSPLSPDPLVKRLVPNPDEVPDLVAVAGWIGKSTKQTHRRLYLTPSMTAYLEVPTDEIVHAEKIGDVESGLGGTMLWLPRDAKVRLRTSDATPAGSAFLEGMIAGMPNPYPDAGSDPFPITWSPRSCERLRIPTTRFTTLCYGFPTTRFIALCDRGER